MARAGAEHSAARDAQHHPRNPLGNSEQSIWAPIASYQLVGSTTGLILHLFFFFFTKKETTTLTHTHAVS